MVIRQCLINNCIAQWRLECLWLPCVPQVATQQFPRPSTIAMAGNKSFHGCFQVFIKNSWGISIITAWMSVGNLPSLKIMHPTWAEILWHKFVKFYRCLYSWGANLPPLPPPTIQTSATLQSFIFISFQQMTFNLGNFNFKASFLVKLTELR